MQKNTMGVQLILQAFPFFGLFSPDHFHIWRSTAGWYFLLLPSVIIERKRKENAMEMIRRKSWIAGAVLSVPLAGAAYYTWKVDAVDQAGKISQPGNPFIVPMDAAWIGLIAVMLCILLKECFIRFSVLSWRGMSGQIPALPLGLVLFLAWFPFLLALYPSPGMNDTVYMMENPLRAGIQFPWATSLFWGYGTEWSQHIGGSREPFIFCAALFQMGIMAAALAHVASWAERRFGQMAGWGLFAYFALFPMVGNYAIASVRDPLYSLALLGWTIYLLEAERGKKLPLWFLALLFLAPPLLRSNGLIAVGVLGIAGACLTKNYVRHGIIFLLCAAVSVLPGNWILASIGEEPLFQEAAAVPLQQMGRVLVMEGDMDGETRALLSSYLSEEAWKKAYSPYTVDFVKWHEEFRRSHLNETRGEFIHAWWETGLRNPRIYAEGWMTETYALWNLDPLEHQVQSRFGWALTDENTEHMQPSDNDAFATGDLPIPALVKSAVGLWSFEGSRFLGAGFSLWLTVLLGAVLYVKGRARLLFLFLPLWINTASLLGATPASAVFRYSFGYVLILPIAALVALEETSGVKNEEVEMVDAAHK